MVICSHPWPARAGICNAVETNGIPAGAEHSAGQGEKRASGSTITACKLGGRERGDPASVAGEVGATPRRASGAGGATRRPTGPARTLYYRTAGRPHNHPHKACAWTVGSN